MRMRFIVSFIATVTGCTASPSYVFRPTPQAALEDAPGDLDGQAAATYPVPADHPRGEIKLATLELARMRLPKGRDGQPIRALHVRVVVHNGDKQLWTVDTSAFTGDFGSVRAGSPVLALLDGAEMELAVLMPGETRTIDLYYELPTSVDERAAAPSLQVKWSVRTPGRLIAQGRTGFEGHEVPPPTPVPIDPKQVAKQLARSLPDDGMPQPSRGDATPGSSWRN